MATITITFQCNRDTADELGLAKQEHEGFTIKTGGVQTFIDDFELVETFPCQSEFGEHEHDKDNPVEECERIMADMCESAATLDQMYPSYDPQYDHFQKFGRPAFPNEY